MAGDGRRSVYDKKPYTVTPKTTEHLIVRSGKPKADVINIDECARNTELLTDRKHRAASPRHQRFLLIVHCSVSLPRYATIYLLLLWCVCVCVCYKLFVIPLLRTPLSILGER